MPPGTAPCVAMFYMCVELVLPVGSFSSTCSSTWPKVVLCHRSDEGRAMSGLHSVCLRFWGSSPQDLGPRSQFRPPSSSRFFFFRSPSAAEALLGAVPPGSESGKRKKPVAVQRRDISATSERRRPQFAYSAKKNRTSPALFAIFFFCEVLGTRSSPLRNLNEHNYSW